MKALSSRAMRSYWLIVLPFFFLTSCSTVTTSEGMTPDSTVFVDINQHSESLSLLVSGETRGITLENFKQALANGITSSGLFSEVVEGGEFLLEVKLKNISQPLFGAGFTISIDSTWRLFRLSNRELVWTEEVNSVYKGGALEGGLIGANRARVATERAARENIQQGIRKLGQVEINQDLENTPG